MSSLDVRNGAYVAGLFDGEGSIILSTRRGGTKLYLRCTISNCHRGVLEWLQETTGTGSIVLHHCGNEKHATGWNWVCYGPVAASFLRELLPYLIVKRAQALDALEEVKDR